MFTDEAKWTTSLFYRSSVSVGHGERHRVAMQRTLRESTYGIGYFRQVKSKLLRLVEAI